MCGSERGRPRAPAYGLDVPVDVPPVVAELVEVTPISVASCAAAASVWALVIKVCAAVVPDVVDAVVVPEVALAVVVAAFVAAVTSDEAAGVVVPVLVLVDVAPWSSRSTPWWWKSGSVARPRASRP